MHWSIGVVAAAWAMVGLGHLMAPNSSRIGTVLVPILSAPTTTQPAEPAGVSADVASSAVPAPPVSKARHFLALTMYHEARGQGPAAMRAVGWVVLNRARSDGFPDGIHDVVVQPTRSGKCQFGWACGDLGRDLDDDAAWRQAQAVAERLLFEPGRDPTKGAIWFWEASRPRPEWLGRNVRETLELGGHSFYAPARLG